MRDRDRRDGWFSRRLVMGLILVTLGVLFYLHNVHGLGIDRLWRFWPLLLGVLAIERFVNRGLLAMEGHVLLMVGTGLQLIAMGKGWMLNRGWPLAVIWVGVLIVLRALLPQPARRLCQDSEERSL